MSQPGATPHDPDPDLPPSDAPLAGLRVIDAADGVGEMCGRMLADFGADVIRLEPPQGAQSRRMAPLSPDGDTSYYFAYRNFNKRGITLDIQSQQGQTQLFKLLESADIYLHSAKPSATQGTDLAPDSLSQQFPHLIVGSLTAFGQTGPYADYEPTPDVVFALSGWLAGSGLPNKPPLLMPGAQPYDFAGVIGCFAVLCALIQRHRTGRGQHLDVSALESLAQCNTWQLTNASAARNAGVKPMTLRSGTSPVYPLFPTKDGYARPVILSPHQWRNMWQWLGEPEEFAAPEWGETLFRMTNLDVLNPYIERLFAQYDMEECAKEGQRRGVVVVPMLKASDVLVNEHYQSRSTFTQGKVAPDVAGAFVNGWMEIASERLGYRFRPPQVGEHTERVLSKERPKVEILGTEAGGAESAEAGGAQSAEAGKADSSSSADGTGSAGSATAAQLPLAGLRVMDFGHGGVGVEGGRMLAEYGADVIKIESRTYYDFIRTMLASEMNGSFASSNRSKRSFGVVARTPEGRQTLLNLAQHSDIVIENNSTGTMDKMGVGYSDLSQANPKIVLVSSQMMGSHGAYGDWIGYGPTIQTVGGLTWLWNFDDGDPPPGSIAIHPDHIAGRIAAIGALLGIWQNLKSGSGFHAELAQVENLIGLLGDVYLHESIQPGSVKPMGNDSLMGAPWGVFPCEGEEQWCVICVRSDHDWQALKEVMGNPDWASGTAYDTSDGRLASRAQLNEGVAKWTSTLAPREVMSRCQQAGVPAGAMFTVLDQMEDPHYQARGFMVEIEQQEIGKVFMEGPAFVGSDMADINIFQAPMLGEHTLDICQKLLGMNREELDQLVADGILELSLKEIAEREAAES